jgi:hypothetical protein
MRTLAILAGALLAVGISAASAQEVWQGDLFVAKVTGTCTVEKIAAVGDFYRAVYRPNLAPPPPNQADEALSLITERSAFILEATGKTLRGKGNANGIVIGSRAEVGEAATAVDLTITLAKTTSGTPSVEIKGTINNLFNRTGCNVTVVGALGLAPPVSRRPKGVERLGSERRGGSAGPRC